MTKFIPVCLLLVCLTGSTAGESHILDGESTIISALPAEDRNTCPVTSCLPWLQLNVTTCKCECVKKNFKGIVNCDPNDKSASVLDCYCATYNSTSIPPYTLVGSCFYNCGNNDKDILYHNITSNNSLCSLFNRDGIFCGKCKDNYYPLAYSFNMTCVQNCSNHKANWVYFITLATVPSTLFFIITIIFRINITSSYLHGFVLFSQGISFPANMRIVLRAVESAPWPGAAVSTRIIVSFYGFCILDFFRPLLPNICLRLTTLQVLSLDYIVAVYPLLLIIFSYIMVTLYYYNFKVIVIISYPFRKIFSHFQKAWNIRASIMEAYATFFLLSYAKFLGASFDILMPTYIHSTELSEHRLASYYDANLNYFKGQHLPLALTALAMLIVFVVLPTLTLLLYPFRFSQVVLRRLRLNNSVLDLFVKPFYRSYRDGTEANTYDCRWFSALFLILRIILPLLYSFTLGSVFLPLAVIVIFIFVMILITVKPYKSAYSHFIKFDVTFLLLLALFYLSMISIDVSSIKDHRLVHASYCLTLLFGVVPLFYVGLLTVYWIISNCKGNYRRQLLGRVISVWQPQQAEREDSREDEEPDRLVNPTEYLNNTSLKASGSVGHLTKESFSY